MSASVLQYDLRVRDLVHGFVYLTELEKRVINHALFQRLRHIRQNDVAFTVYPSLNISRFEHSLGCVSVAGRMATNLMRSPESAEYLSEIDLNRTEFEQVCRLYGLLHDVGHLPLSHLFEIAFEDYAGIKPIKPLVQEWFGGEGFSKLHEACGYAAALKIMEDTRTSAHLKDKVSYLMGKKKLTKADPLRPIKLVIDSEIDADRIDSTTRDGLLAGREYGTYDIDRLCSAVFLQRHELGWRLTYSHKALGSIESLLLDRYRTHRWIHFHHQVVAMKTAVRELIGKLLKDGAITKESFPIDRPNEMALRDDVWLWTLLRSCDSFKSDPTLKAAQDFAVYRDKSVVPLWKHRDAYNRWVTACLNAAALEIFPQEKLDRRYEELLSERLGLKAAVFQLRFHPVGIDTVPLTSEDGARDAGSLLTSSRLIASLDEIWARDPQFYIVIFGTTSNKRDEISLQCVMPTAEWIS
jgi:HD superfamily phosphohydrolase